MSSIVRPEYSKSSEMQSASPLQPVAKWINWAYRVNFFPLKFELDQEVFTPLQWPLLKLSILILSMISMIIMINTGFYFLGMKIWLIVEALGKHGLTVTDIAVMLGIYLPLMFTSTSQFIAYREVAEPMTRFCRQMANLKGINLTRKEVEDHFSLVTRRSWLMIMGLGISAFLYAYICINALEINWSPLVNISCILVSAICFSTNFVSPTMVVTYLILQQSLGTVELALKKCVDKYQEKMVIPEFLNTCQHLVKVLEALEDAFGKVMLIDTTGNSICGTLGFFFGTLIFGCYSTGSFNIVVLLCGLDFLVVGCICTTRLTHLLLKGQRISNELERVKKMLRQLLIQDKNCSQIEKDSILGLLDEWSSGAAIRPKDVFDLNQSTGMSIAGTLLTYIIVLLQFKFGC